MSFYFFFAFFAWNKYIHAKVAKEFHAKHAKMSLVLRSGGTPSIQPQNPATRGWFQLFCFMNDLAAVPALLRALMI